MLAFLVLVAGVAGDSVGWTDPVGPNAPWGIHIAYGADESTQMTIQWSTRAAVQESIVTLLTPTAKNVSGTTEQFSNNGNIQMIHRVSLSNLAPATKYTYTCGSSTEQSEVFSFTTQTAAPTSYTLAIWGDMGISANALSTMPLLLKDIEDGEVDVLVHVGDAAYDLNSNAGTTGDQFMVQMQPVAANIPYMICPGNHENNDDFYHYRKRLGSAMPLASNCTSQGGEGIFHSFNVGYLHMIMVSSEVFFSVQPHSAGLVIEQSEWLTADLKAVDRTATPFVALGLHQPFYCSANDDQDDCHQLVSAVRLGLEKIIYEGGVDIVFQAHEHAYERNYPVYDWAWNSSRTGPEAYVDYKAPIHILTGAAGCPENQDAWQKTANPFSALRVNDYGYSRLHVTNQTHMTLEYVDNVAGKVLDTVNIVKSSTKAAFP